MLGAAARLVAAGTEPVAGLVLPNGRFFPDTFDGSRAAVERLVSRMARHAGLSDRRFDLIVSDDGAPSGASSCSSGACAPKGGGSAELARQGDGYRIALARAEIGHPVVLTTALARAMAQVLVLEAEVVEQFAPQETRAAIDLAAVFMGFGVLLCNGAYIYAKGCGGVRIAQATLLGVEELAAALAVFCVLHGLPKRSAAGDLDTTARACFSEAWPWAQSNHDVIRMLRTSPEAVEQGAYRLRSTQSWLARAFGRREGAAPSTADLERAVNRAREKSSDSERADSERAARLAALSALVDESFKG
jgi:hypothetical protein